MWHQRAISISLLFLCAFSNGNSGESIEKRIANLEKMVHFLVKSQGEAASSFDKNKLNKNKFSVIEPKTRTTDIPPVMFIMSKFPQELSRSFVTALSFLDNPAAFIKTAAKIPNKFLLHGPPGCGKSYLAELIAQEFQLPFIYLKASDLEDKWYGESSRKITEVFNYRDPNGRPVVLFIDEIDAVAFQRKDGMSDAARSTINALLIELQKHSYDTSIFIIVATNNKTALDAAILSRFEGLCVEIKPMSYEDRKLFLKDILSGIPVEKRDRTIEILAQKAAGLSRRALSTAIESAYSWIVADSRGFFNELTLNDILFFVDQAKHDMHVSFLYKIKRFMRETHFEISYAHTAVALSMYAIKLGYQPFINDGLYKLYGLVKQQLGYVH